MPPTPEHRPRADAQATLSWEQQVRVLLAYGLRLGMAVDVAEELVHEAIVRVADQDGGFESDGLRSMGRLKVTLRNLWFDRGRARGIVTRARPKLRLVEPTPDPAQRMAGRHAQDCRRALLAALTPGEREVFALWLRQRSGELSGSEVAARLDLTYAAWEAAKKRLRRRLSAVLEELDLRPQDLFGPMGEP